MSQFVFDDYYSEKIQELLSQYEEQDLIEGAFFLIYGENLKKERSEFFVKKFYCEEDTDLILAIEDENEAKVQEILKNQPNQMLTLCEKFTVCHFAALSGNVKIFKILLSVIPKSILLERKNTGNTCLHVAALEGHVEIVRLLLDADESILLMQNDNGDTALHSAVRRGHVDVLRVLLSKNSEFSFWGMGNKIGRNAHRLAMTLNNYELMCCFFKYNIR